MTSNTFKKAANDPFLPIALEFCRAVCTTVEPFLKVLQTGRLMAVFLYKKVGGLMLSLIERFVKPEDVGLGCLICLRVPDLSPRPLVVYHAFFCKYRHRRNWLIIIHSD